MTPLWRDRRVRLLLLFALILRVVVALDLWANDPLTRVLISDPAYYDAWARALAAGEPFHAGRAYWLPPLYPHALGLLYRVTGGALHATIAVQLGVGLVTTALVVLLCERVAGRRAALFAGSAWTLYAPVVFLETRLLGVAAALLPCAGALVLLARAADSERGRRGLAASGAGFLCGIGSLAHPNLLLCAPAAALALLAGRAQGGFGTRTRLALGLLLGLGLGVSPSALRNQRASGEWIPVTANGGINFWFGNNEQARGTFHAPGPEWGEITAQRDVALALATRSSGATDPLSDAEASDYWFARGRRWIARHPGDAARLWSKKLADTLSSTEFDVQYFLPASWRSARTLRIACVPFGLLLALGALGFTRDVRARGLLSAWVAAGIAGSLLYFTYSRFRLPFLLAWMPFVGAGAARFVDALRGRRELGLVRSVVALALLAQSFVPFEGDYPRHLLANSSVDAAVAWRTLGDPVRARALLEETLREVPIHPKALVELGKLELLAGDERAARQRFAVAWSMPGAYPDALLHLSRLERTASDPSVRDTSAAFARLTAWLDGANDVDPFWSAAKVELGGLLLARGDEAEAARHFAEAWSAGGANVDALYQLAGLELRATRADVRDPRSATARLRAWLARAPRSHAFRSEIEVLLAAGLFDRPDLEVRPGEARELASGVLEREPANEAARIVLKELDRRD